MAPKWAGYGGWRGRAKQERSMPYVASPLPVGLVPEGTKPVIVESTASSSSSQPGGLGLHHSGPFVAGAVVPMTLPAGASQAFARQMSLQAPLEPAKDARLEPMPNHKSALCQFLGKALHKSLQKNDLMFETLHVGNGYKSTLKCPSIPVRFRCSEFIGEVYTDKKNAEQSAAKAAVTALSLIPELVAEATTSKEDRIMNKRQKMMEREQVRYARDVQHQIQASQHLARQHEQQQAVHAQLLQLQQMQQMQQLQLQQHAQQQAAAQSSVSQAMALQQSVLSTFGKQEAPQQQTSPESLVSQQLALQQSIMATFAKPSA